MTIVVMIAVGCVFLFCAVVAVLAIATIGKNVAKRLKEQNVNLKDGVNLDELTIVGKLLAEEAQKSKELELLTKIKEVAEKALANRAA